MMIRWHWIDLASACGTPAIASVPFGPCQRDVEMIVGRLQAGVLDRRQRHRFVDRSMVRTIFICLYLRPFMAVSPLVGTMKSHRVAPAER